MRAQAGKYAMKIVLFGNAPDKIAAIRYRVIKFADMLQADGGHRCVVCLPSSIAAYEQWYEGRSQFSKLLYLFYTLLRRVGQMRHVIAADVVFFRGPLLPYLPPFLERLIHWINPRMVFDIDDAIWEPPAHVHSPMLRFVDFGWTRKMCGMCMHAVVGNEYLREYVSQYMDREAVTIIPTCVDMEIHQPPKVHDPARKPVVLGWTGLSDNLGYLKPIEPIIQELAKKYELAMDIATAKEYQLEGVRVENHYWVKEHEVDYLRAADIGLMPLHHTKRALGKCAFKAIQYMAVGVPAIITPVGMNAAVVEDGVHGFLADSPEEWREKLERLITDAALRAQMGEVARERVIAEYSHEANYPKFKRVMETVAATREKQ
jgi:glycosyltransferase involved in cell wall biosynthesis